MVPTGHEGNVSAAILCIVETVGAILHQSIP